MAAFKVSVPHGIGRQTALSRVRLYLDDLHGHYAHEVSNVRAEWHDNRLEFVLTIRGFEIQGMLIVEADVVHVSGLLQLGLVIFRKRIEETIELELTKLLSPVPDIG
jgi:hypothetical protein